jgi:hypothetical protein
LPYLLGDFASLLDHCLSGSQGAIVTDILMV